jgi:hypothetical protein
MTETINDDPTSQVKVARPGDRLREQWKRWIMMQLGAPVIKVELTEAQVDEFIDSAIKRMSQWGMFEEVCIFRVTPKENGYDLLEMIPEYINVKDVIYSPNQAESLLQGFFTDFAFDNRSFFWYHSTYASMTDFYILNAYNEMYLRTIGNEGQWKVVGNKLYLSPTPDKPVWAAIEYTAFPDKLDVRRDEWIREWALSECMMALGNIRGKYSQLPGPRGELQLDGEQMITRAVEKQEKLLERLNEYIEPALFETG